MTGTCGSSGLAGSLVERRYQASPLLSSRLARCNVYSYGPAFTRLSRRKASLSVVPPLTASTTLMPLPLVSAPGPPAFLICRLVLPPALPPSITIWSDGESSV
ncbi:hypothetical protein D3C80_1535830 [compost metagenome]